MIHLAFSLDDIENLTELPIDGMSEWLFSICDAGACFFNRDSGALAGARMRSPKEFLLPVATWVP